MVLLVGSQESTRSNGCADITVRDDARPQLPAGLPIKLVGHPSLPVLDIMLNPSTSVKSDIHNPGRNPDRSQDHGSHGGVAEEG